MNLCVNAILMKISHFQQKNGRRYSPAIRKLYYTLLSQQIPSVKIADMRL